MARFRMAGMLMLLCALWTGPGIAQINPFGRSSSMEQLSQEDLRLMNVAADKVRSDGTSIGGSEAWSNPESGNSGTVSLLSIFETQKMPCRKLRYTFSFRNAADKPSYELNFCRIPSGEWKLL